LTKIIPCASSFRVCWLRLPDISSRERIKSSTEEEKEESTDSGYEDDKESSEPDYDEDKDQLDEEQEEKTLILE
jgi:hypothetical protein